MSVPLMRHFDENAQPIGWRCVISFGGEICNSRPQSALLLVLPSPFAPRPPRPVRLLGSPRRQDRNRGGPLGGQRRAEEAVTSCRHSRPNLGGSVPLILASARRQPFPGTLNPNCAPGLAIVNADQRQGSGFLWWLSK